MKKQTSVPNTIATSQGKIFVPLSALYISPDNVRKGVVTGIAELAAMIESQSLLNPLQVEKDEADTGKFGVVAGGRRLRALQLLAKNGKIPADHLIECGLVNDGMASEVSLAENISQEAMHPADEFTAYQTLVTEGKTVESIAAKFGVSVAHVARRLKMANVAPALLDLYKNNEMTLDQIMAFASIDDQERQVNTWNGLPPYNRQPHNIKSKLTEDEVAATDKRVNFVGIQTYLDAGGEIRTDLFAEGDNRFLTDMGLLEMLVSERLELEAEAMRKAGWLWVETLPAFGYEERQHYQFPIKRYLDETPEIEAQRLALEAEMAELRIKSEAANEAEEYDEEAELDEKIEAIDARIDALRESLLDTSAHDKTKSGVIVSLDADGLVILQGMVRNSDRKKEGRSDENGKPTTRADVPEKLMFNLSSHRTAAIQAMMIDNQQVSLAALATKMAFSTFGEHKDSPVKISLTHAIHTLEKHAPTLHESRAAAAISDERSAWKERLPEDSKEWFGWFLSQKQEVILSMIVFATASCTEALQGRCDGVDGGKQIASALNLNMADWWEATPDTYLDLVPKTKLIEMVLEVAGHAESEVMVKMKKPDAIEHAMTHMKGSRWLPSPLRSVSE